MTDDELNELGRIAEKFPREILCMQAALCLRAAELNKEHVRIFLECLGGSQGPKFLGLIDDVIIEDGKKEPT